MKILGLVVSSNRILSQALLVFLLVSAFAGAERVSAQKQTGAGSGSPQEETVITRNGDTVEIRTYIVGRPT
jgi:hypothetical protein